MLTGLISLEEISGQDYMKSQSHSQNSIQQQQQQTVSKPIKEKRRNLVLLKPREESSDEEEDHEYEDTDVDSVEPNDQHDITDNITMIEKTTTTKNKMKQPNGKDTKQQLQPKQTKAPHNKNTSNVVDNSPEILAEDEDDEKEEEVAESMEGDTEETEFELPPSDWDEFDLHPLLLRGLHALNFTTPTPIQKATLTPAIRNWRDIIGCAQTGSG
jgi:hypothetical protein